MRKAIDLIFVVPTIIAVLLATPGSALLFLTIAIHDYIIRKLKC